MLANRTAGQASKFTIPLIDDAGAPINATSATWQLLDALGASIASGGATLTGGSAVFDVPGEQLTLADGETSAGREMVLHLDVAGDQIELRDYFVIVDSRPLAPMVNTFQPYAEALATRQGFGPVLSGWDANQDVAQRCQALSEAFERLLRVGYKVSYFSGARDPMKIAAWGTGTDCEFGWGRNLRLRGMSKEEFDTLPAVFIKALKRAQLVEADVILGGDIIGRKRRDGIISETIGESSVFLSSKPYLNLPISRQAYEEVQSYVVFRVMVARG